MKYLLYILEGIVELILILVHFPMYLLNELIPLKLENGKPTQKYPIIIVERWFRHNVFHIFAKYYLEKKGFKVYSINYSLAHGTFDDAAKHLEGFIASKNLHDVVLVGISAGALTCLQYLQKRDGWKKTHLCISIAGPLKGSTISSFFPVTSSIRDMIPSASYLQTLYEGGLKHTDRIYCIYATLDNLVSRTYSVLPGTHRRHIDVVGHNLLHTFWIPTYKEVARIASE